ncbi:MAG: preprotein translocase subunit SecE [Acidimicrobiia bacterium]
MAKSGADQRPKPPERRPVAQQAKERTSPGQFLSEVRGELRKVAWPTKQEVVNSTIIVLIAVVVMGTLIFGFDWASSKLVLHLYQ